MAQMFTIPKDVTPKTLNFIQDVLRYTEESLKKNFSLRADEVEAVFSDVRYQLQCEVEG